MGRWRIGILSVLAMALAAPAAQAAELPWVKDVAMFRAALPELNRGGVKALGPHVAQFEAALENGRQFFPDGVVVDDKRYVLAGLYAVALAEFTFLLPTITG